MNKCKKGDILTRRKTWFADNDTMIWSELNIFLKNYILHSKIR